MMFCSHGTKLFAVVRELLDQLLGFLSGAARLAVDEVVDVALVDGDLLGLGDLGEDQLDLNALGCGLLRPAKSSFLSFSN